MFLVRADQLIVSHRRAWPDDHLRLRQAQSQDQGDRSAGRQTLYAYDGRGNLLSVSLPDHAADGNRTVSTFGRQVSSTLPDPEGAGPLSSPRGTVVYDLTATSSPAPTLGRVTTYVYEA